MSAYAIFVIPDGLSEFQAKIKGKDGGFEIDPKLTNVIKTFPQRCFNQFQKLLSDEGRNLKAHYALIASVIISGTQCILHSAFRIACLQFC